MSTSAPDGRLYRWDEIAPAHEWQVLLLGNGLSMNLWPTFGYSRLLDEAGRAELTEIDKALFGDRVNFERVLADLSTAIRVNAIVGMSTDVLYAHYRSIQLALGRAVRHVHPNRSSVSDDALAVVRNVMEDHEWIFTTSYDLLLYWAMGYGGTYSPFRDFFQYDGRCLFDPRRSEVYDGQIPVYYLHGALHLVVGSSGDTWKLRLTSLQTILQQFGQPIAGDPQARALLVTEGSAEEKRRTIESNAYLSHALDRLEQASYPTVAFGSRLGEEDDHIVSTLSERPRPIAVSMRPDSTQRERARLQIDLWGRLGIDELYFYDSTTHPLGDESVRAS